MKIHHIGYLVKSIKKSLPDFENLGYKAESDIIYDSLRDIDILFLTNNKYRIELVQSKGPNSIVANIIKFLNKEGGRIYHICYCCNDIEITCRNLREKGFIPASEIESAIAIDGHKVCFMFKRTIGIIELVEMKETK